MSPDQQLIEELLFINEALRLVTQQMRRIPGIKSQCLILEKRKKKILKMRWGMAA